MIKKENQVVRITLSKKDYQLFCFFAKRNKQTPTRFIRKILENINDNRKMKYFKMIENGEKIPDDIKNIMDNYFKNDNITTND